MGDWQTARGRFDLPTAFLTLEPGEERLVRFLGGLDDSVAIQFHERCGRMRPQPCVRYLGRECPFCVAGTFKATYKRVWSVFDYGLAQRKIVVVRGSRELESIIKAGDALDFKYRDLIIRRVEKRNEFRFEELTQKPVLTDLQRYLSSLAVPYTVDEVVEFFKPLITVLEIPPDDGDIPEGCLVPGGDPLLSDEED
jgi:hypothetical protein